MSMGAILVQFGFFIAYVAATTFWPAGTFCYPAGWTLLILMVVGGVAITVWLARHDPALLRKRMSAPIQRGQESWDRIFLVVLMLGYTLWMAFSSWDAARHGFVAVPLLVQGVGALGVAFYMWGAWR